MDLRTARSVRHFSLFPMYSQYWGSCEAARSFRAASDLQDMAISLSDSQAPRSFSTTARSTRDWKIQPDFIMESSALQESVFPDLAFWAIVAWSSQPDFIMGSSEAHAPLSPFSVARLRAMDCSHERLFISSAIVPHLLGSSDFSAAIWDIRATQLLRDMSSPSFAQILESVARRAFSNMIGVAQEFRFIGSANVSQSDSFLSRFA